MAVSLAKINAAIARAKRVRGISVPPGVENSLIKLLVSRAVAPWRAVANAVHRVVPAKVPDATFDASMHQDVPSLITSIYDRYSGLTSLQKEMKKRYEAGEKFHRAQFLTTVRRAIGVDASHLLADATARAAVEKALSRSIDFITKMDAEAMQRLRMEIFNAMANGDDSVSIKKMLIEKEHLPKNKAKLIARDQMNKLYSNLAQVRNEEIGVKGYTWRTSDDERVRPKHAALDGLPFAWADPPSEGPPGWAVQCRCVADPDFSSITLQDLM